MTSNASLLQKADLALADLSANGGLMQPEQGAAFIRKLIKTPTILPQVRVVEMTSPQRKINKIGFDTRILRAGTQGTALGAPSVSGLGGRAKPTTSQITLTTKEVIAQVNLPYDVLEDNIERMTVATNAASNSPWSSGLQETIVTLIAERAALDLEELCLLADTSYTNGGDADDQAYLSMFDGWLKKGASGHVVDWSNAAIAKEMFKKGLKAMPVQYQRNLNDMKHFVSVNQEIEYRDTIANRVGALGDSQVQGRSTLSPFGVPLEAAQLMPEASGLFTNPKNLIFGIQRQVSLEFDKDITTRVYVVVLTARIAIAVEEVDAMVKYTNIGTPA
jgi:hypothetical protein